MEFQYEELPPNFIRLLTLLPGQYADPLACTIQAADLDAVKDEYDALSYSWATEDGNAKQEFPLLLNDTPIMITRNLYDGLKRIRLVDRDLRLWVDAVCINQQNDVEKSVQVARMADIYAGARSVLVWLGGGEDAEEDELLLNMFEQIPDIAATVGPLHRQEHCFTVALLGKSVSRCPGCVEDSKVVTDVSDNYGEDHTRGIRECVESCGTTRQHSNKACNAVQKFMNRRYWKRRWIVQELYHARKQSWYWGRCSINVSAFPTGWLEDFWVSADTVGSILKKFARQDNQPPLPPSQCAPSEAVPSSILGTRVGASAELTHTWWIIRNMFTGLSIYCMPQTVATREPIAWNRCLQHFHYAECSDPKDIYYALASIITPRIPIDYSLTFAESLVEVAMALINDGKWAYVLYWAAKTAVQIQALHREDSVYALPSWVPNPEIVLFDQHGLVKEPPMSILREDWVLICDVRCLGALHGSGDKPELRWDPVFWDICSTHKQVDDENEESFWDTYQNADDRSTKLAPLQPIVTQMKLMHH